jgi:methylmalonyl-CoA/ethylmalonyl-CoA epimerase
MFEKYTEQARRVIFFARYEASMYGAAHIEPEHLLLALGREDAPMLSRLLDLEKPLDELRRRLEARADLHQKLSTTAELPLGRDTKRAMAFAYEESERRGHPHLSTGHLLAGLVRAEGTLAAQVLDESGLTLEAARGNLEPAETSPATDDPARAVGRAAAASKWPDATPLTATMKIEHIGIATPRIDDALLFWRDALGLEVQHTEVVEEQGVRVAMLPAGEPRVELLEPTGADSPVAQFLEKRGPGIHHIAVRVPDIRAALARLKDAGARLIDAEPRVGAGGCLVAFVHPKSAGGVLLELVEHTRPAHDPELER